MKHYDVTNQVSYTKEENRKLRDVVHVPSDNQNYIEVPKTPRIFKILVYIYTSPQKFLLLFLRFTHATD